MASDRPVQHCQAEGEKSMIYKIYTESSGAGGGDGADMRQVSETEVMVAYLLLKVQQRDWHGVADAANDIRVMEAEEKRDE